MNLCKLFYHEDIYLNDLAKFNRRKFKQELS